MLSGVRSKTTGDDPNRAEFLVLMSRTRVRGARPSSTRRITSSLSKSRPLVSLRAFFPATSHWQDRAHLTLIVKEIEPNAPVVTVTLGGPGHERSTRVLLRPKSVDATSRLDPTLLRRAIGVLAFNNTTATNNILDIQPPTTSLQTWSRGERNVS